MSPPSKKPTEKCWRCHKQKNDVALWSTDDRLCQSCFDKNEAALKRDSLNLSPVNAKSQQSHRRHRYKATSYSKNRKQCGLGQERFNRNGILTSCLVCHDDVASASCWPSCDVCQGHYHPACIKMDDTAAAMLQPLITTVGWVCLLPD